MTLGKQSTRDFVFGTRRRGFRRVNREHANRSSRVQRQRTVKPAMVFKPFKPPLIRKPSQPAESTPTNENETTRPGKRPRLSESGAEVDNGEKRESGTERPLDNSVGIKLGPSRGPLTQIKNGPPGQTVGDSGSDASRSRGNGGDDVEAYYNVLWFVKSLHFALADDWFDTRDLRLADTIT